MAKTRTFTIMVRKYPYIPMVSNDTVVQIQIIDRDSEKNYELSHANPDAAIALNLATHAAADILVREL